MATYFDKKKLLEDNSDLYISPYDKNLDVGSLSQIIDAKKEYKSAQESGDTQAMAKANNKANSLRKSAGKYTGGNDGSEYNRSYADYETGRPAKYNSKYRGKIENILGSIDEADDFEYNPETDPLFQSYKKIYLTLGNDAYDRALSENALRTGGMINSSAQSAAMQARNKYNSMLASKVPELYELAYSKYRDGISDTYDRLDALNKLDSEDYSRYRDTVKDFESDRDYFYTYEKDFEDLMYEMYKDDTDTEYKLLRDQVENKLKTDEFNYQKERDSKRDEQWKSEFDLSREKAKDSNYLNQLKTAISYAKALSGRYPASGSTFEKLLGLINGY